MVQLSVVSRAESPEISSAIEALQAEFTRLKGSMPIRLIRV